MKGHPKCPDAAREPTADYPILGDHASLEEPRAVTQNQRDAMHIAFNLTVEVNFSFEVTFPIIVRSAPIVPRVYLAQPLTESRRPGLIITPHPHLQRIMLRLEFPRHKRPKGAVGATV